MITSEQEYQITQERIHQFRAARTTVGAHPTVDPDAQQATRASVASVLEALTREARMWEAGIREPVPGNPDPVPPPWTVDQVNAMSDEEYQRASDHAAALLKRAEIANIDVQIGLSLDRIADWRRHRAWLELEIAEIEATASVPSA